MMRRFVALCLAVAAFSLLAASAQPALAAAVFGRVQAAPDFVELVKREGATVVNISSARAVHSIEEHGSSDFLPDNPLSEVLRRLFPPNELESERPNVGSGFIISEDGYILTNAHLVTQIEEATVRLVDGRELKAKVIGLDLYTDVALIKVAATGLRKVKIGSALGLEVGEWVAAIGSPFGLENSVTAGIVSAIGRYFPNESRIPFIQTDVAVNPGNSGGPLFNLSGEVVGINSMIYSASGGYMGLSFAVPIDVAMKVADELRVHGRVSRGRLGVRLQEMTSELAASFRLKEVTGALVVGVEKSGPAADAGFRASDVILNIDGKTITSSGELLLIVAGTAPGARAEFGVWRGGATMRLTVTIGELGLKEGAVARRLEESRIDRLGLTLIELTARERQALEAEGSLLVRSASGAARNAGIRQGDMILAINDAQVDRIADLNRALGALAPGSVVALLVLREESRAYVTVRLAGSTTPANLGHQGGSR
ncbi:MAG: Do family serine endopeptidase [Burkholderiales bacterium]